MSSWRDHLYCSGRVATRRRGRLSRLEAITENPEATRYERTTTVPLIDDLVPKLGLTSSFELAMQLQEGNIACRALLVQPAEPPKQAIRALNRRYRRPGEVTLSPRAAVAGAALRHLSDEGVDLRDVELLTDQSLLIPEGSRFQLTSILFSSIRQLVETSDPGSAYSTYGRRAHRGRGWLLRSLFSTAMAPKNFIGRAHDPNHSSTRTDRGAVILKILNADARPR